MGYYRIILPSLVLHIHYYTVHCCVISPELYGLTYYLLHSVTAVTAANLVYCLFFCVFSVDRNKYQIHIPLPPKIDPTVTMMQVT